jgi:hypothetical protein
VTIVMPGVVGPVPPLLFFFEQLEHPDESSANVKRTRYKEVVPRVFRVLSLALVTIVLVCSTGVASANGRFPQAQAIVTVPGSDGATVFMRTTFGILVSRNAGKSWKWICERALGYTGTWDPPIAATRDGRLWVGLERGIVATRDGCAVETSTALAGELIRDLTTDPTGETLWAVTGAPDKRGAVWRLAGAAGGGGSWEQMGLLPENIHPMTLEVAPSRSSRIYVTAQPYGEIRGWLWKSDDAGKTFTVEKNDLAHVGPLFIAAIDPKDPNRVLLRHLHTTGSTVLVTTDAGKTFKETLSMNSAMYGFTRSADGLTLYAASGLAVDGIFRSTDGGEHFERMANHGVLCLHDAPGGRLFICENPFTLGAQAIALSTDQGRTVTPIATFSDVEGPIACAAGPNKGACADSWAETLAQFTSPRDGGARDGSTRPGAPPTRKSCGCEVVGATSRSPDHAWLTAGLIPLVLWARARRRHGSCGSQRGPSRPR